MWNLKINLILFSSDPQSDLKVSIDVLGIDYQCIQVDILMHKVLI